MRSRLEDKGPPGRAPRAPLDPPEPRAVAPGSVAARPMRLVIDQRAVEAEVRDHATLLDLLRERLHLAGTTPACDRGECGACMVFLDGAPAYACLTLAAACEASDVVTIEGLARGEALHPLQRTVGHPPPEGT